MTSAQAGLPAHELTGEGDVVVFLNGGMMTCASWSPVVERLGEGYRRLLFDFRGQLLSPGPARRDLGGHADDVVALLDAHDIDSAHVLGTSFGAAVGIVLAARHPARVRSLGIATATDVATKPLVRGVTELRSLVGEVLAGAGSGAYVARLVAEVYSERYRHEHAADLERMAAHVAGLPRTWFEGLLGILDALEGLDLRSELESIRCPALVIHAAQDALMTRERSLALARGLARSQWLEHPHSGHALVVEDPAWLGDAYRDFLQGVGSGMAGHQGF